MRLSPIVRFVLLACLLSFVSGCDGCGRPVGVAEGGADVGTGDGADSATDPDAGPPHDGAAQRRPPAFVTTMPTEVDEGDTYLYGALAEDPDGDIVHYTKVSGPPDLVVAESTGAVYWPVPHNAAGEHPVEIQAADSSGMTVRQRGTIRVRPVNVDPSIVSTPPRFGATGSAYRYDVVARDPDGDALTYRVDMGPGGARFEGAAFVWPSPTGGRTTVRISVADPSGGTASQTFAIGVPTGAATPPPVVRIDAPAAAAVIEVATPVAGSVTDSDLVGWVLEGCQPDVTGHCAVIARGDAAVPAGALGTLSPQPFLDQNLVLRLTAWDAERNEASATRTVEIASRNHPGIFGVELVDFVTRVDQQEVELTRAYDSRRLTASDFGVGWELRANIQRARPTAPTLAVASDLGSGWRITGGFPPRLEPTAPKTITLDVPGDGRYVFQFDPDFSPVTGGGFATERFASPPGATITPIYEDGRRYRLGDPLVVVNTGGDVELQFDDLTPFEPPAFRIQTPSGATFDMSRRTGLLRSTGYTPGTTGSGVYLAPDGVYGRRGRAVAIDRDAQNRITRIRDLRYTQEVVYEYTAPGLTAVVHPPAGARSTYTYADGRLVDYALPPPLGATRIEYDERGRVARRIGPDGAVLVYTYDDAARTVRIRDAAGQSVVTEYNERGDVTGFTDTMGRRESYQYDAAGRMTERRDPAGRESRWGYDGNGHLTMLAEPGRAPVMVRYTGDVISEMTGPNGRFQTMTSADGRTTRVVGPGGGEAYRLEVDGEGRPLSEGQGSTTRTFHYDSEGRLDQYRDEHGEDFTLRYSDDDQRVEVTGEDGLTFFSEESETGGLSRIGRPAIDGLPEMDVRYEYDFGGDLSRVQIGSLRVEYNHDASGHLVGVRENGAVAAERQFDAAGRVVLEREASGTFHRYRYDAAGRQIAHVTPTGTVEASYDRAGLVAEQTTSSGVRVAYERDEAGRVRHIRDSAGTDVRLAYDAAGRPSHFESPTHGAVDLEYDPATGQVNAMRSAMGTERVTYDTRFPSLEEGEAPPFASRTDANGNRWTFERDAQTRLTAVVHPGGAARTTYRYEEESERVSQITDAAGGEWHMTWQGEDLVELRTPENRVTRLVTEADGTASIVRPDGSGETLRNDGTGRLIRDYGGGLRFVFESQRGSLTATESPTVAVRYEHDASGALTGVVRSDGARASIVRGRGGRLEQLRVTSPTGESASTTYEYGPSDDRIVAITDQAGRRTTFEYSLNRVTAVVRPNGTRTTYRYAACGRPSEIVHEGPGGAVLWRASYELEAGCRLRAAVLPEGRFEYSYDEYNRLAREVRRNASGAVESDTRHVWDAVGNRVRSTDGRGETTRTYDRDGRLTREVGPGGAIEYAYDGRGNLVAETGPGRERRYEYDSADRLTAIRGEGATRELSYDAEGHLVGVEGERRCLTIPGLFLTSGCVAFYGGGQPMRAVLHAPHGVIGDSGASGARYFHGALHNSVAMVTDDTGRELGRAAWDGFGAKRADTRPADVRYGYAGELELGGLVHLRSRWMAPHLAQFTSPDRLAPPSTEDPRSLHRYVYANGNPIDNVDPLGTWTIMGVSISANIQSMQRSANAGATQRARCFIQSQVQQFVAQAFIQVMMGAFLNTLETALLAMTGWAQYRRMGENAINNVLRNMVFCSGGSPPSWATGLLGVALPTNIMFEVDVNECGMGNRRGGVPGRVSNFGTCGSPASLVGGVDFLLGGSVVPAVGGPVVQGGIPVELKTHLDPRHRRTGDLINFVNGPPPVRATEAARAREQNVRYCRYASLSPWHLSVWIFAKRLPPQVDTSRTLSYVRAALECAFPWQTFTLRRASPRAGQPSTYTAPSYRQCAAVANAQSLPGMPLTRPSTLGAILLWVGRDNSRGRNRVRVYHPVVRGLPGC